MKHLNAVKRFSPLAAVALAATYAAASSGGATVDFSPITAGISWGSVATAIVAIIAGGVVIDLAMKGGKKLLSAIRAL